MTMFNSFSTLTVLLLALVALMAAAEVSTLSHFIPCLANLFASPHHLTLSQSERHLGGTDLPYDPTKDECKIGEDEKGFPIFGACNPTEHFPNCDEKKSFICYNRVNRRDKFHPDKNPYYYIDPRRVLCYPNSWLGDGGCR